MADKNEGTVLGLGIGRFGELSAEFIGVCTSIARNRAVSSFLAIRNMTLLSGCLLIGGGGHRIFNVTSHSSLRPESFTSATQPDFVYAIPMSVYVSAGGFSIESRELSGVMFKDFAPPACHDESTASSAFSLGLPCNCGISSQCSSDRHLGSASAAVFAHPCGSLGLCKIYPGAIPKLSLCEDMDVTPRCC